MCRVCHSSSSSAVIDQPWICSTMYVSPVTQHWGNGSQPGLAQGSTVLLPPLSIWLIPHTIPASNLLFTYIKKKLCLVHCTVLCVLYAHLASSPGSPSFSMLHTFLRVTLKSWEGLGMRLMHTSYIMLYRLHDNAGRSMYVYMKSAN